MKQLSQKPNSIPMQIGNDPALWRYASLDDALKANVDLIAHLIRIGVENSQSNNFDLELSESTSIAEVA